MRRIFTLVFTFLFAVTTNAQISISTNGTAFTQDFNTLANTGTNAITTLPAGWTFFETGSGSNTTYTADNGGSNSGNTYSYGSTSATDRAIGTLLSGSVTSTIGASFINNTGLAINSIAISFAGEQWRLGATARPDRLEFQYSTNATTLLSGTYAAETNLNFTAPTTTGTAGALDGNVTANRTNISFTITGLSISPGSTFWIKWNDFNATGADDGLAIDDFSITTTGGADLTPPTVTTFTPLDNATNVSTNTNLQILFNEPIVKGTGNIIIKKLSDNSIVQTIDVTTPAVTVTGSTATIANNPLLNATDYYVEISAGAFTDIALNNFAGITGNSTWNFTTIPVPAAGIIGNNYGFTNCATTFLNEGWSQFSVLGTQSWACVTPGRAASPDNAVQMNAFVAANNNPLNEDWLISPVFDLSTAPAPTLKFYSKGDFTGNTLQLKISNNYSSGTNPNLATWTNLIGGFPSNVAGQGVWTLSDNIDLSTFNTAGITIAWIYINPTTANSSRWTIDDVSIYSSVVLPPCDEPTDQPTNLTLTPTATSTAGSFTPISPAPSGYIVLRSTSATLSASPADATAYSIGQTFGGGIVVANSSATTFTDNGLTPTTQYYYFVFAYNNESCSGGPNYITIVNPAPTGNTNSTTTLALAACVEPSSAPSALNISATNNSISGNFTLSASANRYLVIVSTSNSLSSNPIDGTIYSTGAAFGGGTVVSYGTNNSFTVTGLASNTTYYIYVFAANGDCTGEPDYLSTTSLNGSALTSSGTGAPTTYYDAAAGLTCQALKTALKTIISTGFTSLSYTPGL